MNPGEYDIMAKVEDVHWWYRGLRGLIGMFSGLSIPTGEVSILDVGCGTGANLSMMQRYGRVVGLDVSDDALQFCKERCIAVLTKGDAAALPYADNTFEMVLLMDVLYHREVRDKFAPLREAYRVLKPGGRVLLNVPAYQWLMSPHDAAVHADHRFTRREVMHLLRQSKFDLLRCTYWNALLFPIVVIVRTCLSGRQDGESDLAGYRESLATSILSGVLWCERLLLRVMPLPFGSSIFAVAKKSK